jgi:hypothetical protein
VKITQNPHVILCLNPQNYPWRKCLHIPRSPKRLVAFTGSISMVTTRPFHASTCRAMRVDLSSRFRTVLKRAPPGTKYQRYQRVEVIFNHPDILWDWKLVYSGKFWHDWRLINEILFDKNNHPEIIGLFFLNRICKLIVFALVFIYHHMWKAWLIISPKRQAPLHIYHMFAWHPQNIQYHGIHSSIVTCV